MPNDTVFKPLYEPEDKTLSISKERIPLDVLCVLYGKLITETHTGTNTAEEFVLYTVPDGKVFFLVAAQVSIVNGDTSNQDVYLMICPPTSILGVHYNILRVVCARTPTGVGSAPSNSAATLAPAIPIRVNPGSRLISYNVDTNAESTATIVGYELDIKFLSSI